MKFRPFPRYGEITQKPGCGNSRVFYYLFFFFLILPDGNQA